MTQSRITSQGQISVPLDVRKKLGVGSGSSIEWAEASDQIMIRRAVGYTSEDIRKALFGDEKPTPETNEQLKEGIRQYIRKRYARR